MNSTYEDFEALDNDDELKINKNAKIKKEKNNESVKKEKMQ